MKTLRICLHPKRPSKGSSGNTPGSVSRDTVPTSIAYIYKCVASSARSGRTTPLSSFVENESVEARSIDRDDIDGFEGEFALIVISEEGNLVMNRDHRKGSYLLHRLLELRASFSGR